MRYGIAVLADTQQGRGQDVGGSFAEAMASSVVQIAISHDMFTVCGGPLHAVVTRTRRVQMFQGPSKRGVSGGKRSEEEVAQRTMTV
jgi:hypothetical protein